MVKIKIVKNNKEIKGHWSKVKPPYNFILIDKEIERINLFIPENSKLLYFKRHYGQIGLSSNKVTNHIIIHFIGIYLNQNIYGVWYDPSTETFFPPSSQDIQDIIKLFNL
ncbi:MAG: hypothetical protein ACTSYR_02150 [Candidatus Odinarchaeia archaeon]